MDLQFYSLAIECAALNVPDNGLITFDPDTTAPHSFTTTATYGCNPGYGLSGGDRVRTCVGSSAGPGVWSGTAPMCQGYIILSKLPHSISTAKSINTLPS